MIYFRPVENVEKAKEKLSQRTDDLKPWGYIYDEGFYMKSYGNYFRLMYEDGSMKDSIRGTVCPFFHGVWIRCNKKQYLIGIFTLDWIVTLITLIFVLSGVLVFDFEEAGFMLLGYILFMALSFQKFSYMKNFLAEL